MPVETTRSFQYRYDLDGLRGIAIALVVIYHVFVGRVSGGVDVFLLLSGYFFLGSQLRYADKVTASLNPWWPLWRMIRRIFPALIVVVGITYGALELLTPQLMGLDIAKQIRATIFYGQNWELARQNADYNAASVDTSPFQHLWSMSVQGQFYLLGIAFALLLAAGVQRYNARAVRAGAFARGRTMSVATIAGPILIVVTIISFAYASRYGLFGTAENYYSTWARMWELTLGTVLALYGSRITVPARLYDAFTGVGLLLIVITGALIADSTAFPGPLSLIPLGGAVLIIVGGGGRISRMMATRRARWLGDIAYCLYLWHWPLLIISTSLCGFFTPPWWLGLIIIALSLVLADLTHRFVENPLRQHRPRPLLTDHPLRTAVTTLHQPAGAARAAGGSAVAAITVALLILHPVLASTVTSQSQVVLTAQNYPGAMALFGEPVPAGVEVQPDPLLVGDMMPPVAQVHCFVSSNKPADEFPSNYLTGEPCEFGDTQSTVEVYLVGGSHAEQWSSALDQLGKEMGFKVVTLLRQACPLEYGTLNREPECIGWRANAIDKILAAKPALVISNSTRPQSEIGYGPDIVPTGYLGFWQLLAANSIPFLGLRDNPWGFDATDQPQNFADCYATTREAIGCGMRRDQVYQPVDPAAEILAQWDNMASVDTADWFCDEVNCPVVIGNVLVYRDMHHISNAYAESTAPLLRTAIEPFLVDLLPTAGATLPLDEDDLGDYSGNYDSGNR